MPEAFQLFFVIRERCGVLSKVARFFPLFSFFYFMLDDFYSFVSFILCFHFIAQWFRSEGFVGGF